MPDRSSPAPPNAAGPDAARPDAARPDAARPDPAPPDPAPPATGGAVRGRPQPGHHVRDRAVAEGDGPGAWVACASGILWREALRFVQQKERFLSALVRPLMWLFIFAAGLRSVIELTVQEPYGSAIAYEVYILPGLCAMIQLFQGMQSSLSMVYDRETGAMRALLIAPFPRWFLLAAKLAAAAAVSVLQVYAFLAIAALYGIRLPAVGYLTVLPALIVSGLMLGAIGLFLSSAIRKLENFAGVMNFVIFPMFFASSALYPLWRMAEGSPLLADIAAANPFTYAVELIRFALYAELEPMSLAVVVGVGAGFFAAASLAYDPGAGLMRRR
ncbi:MAG: ABC transporter permease [Pseudomonadota bacterium]